MTGQLNKNNKTESKPSKHNFVSRETFGGKVIHASWVAPVKVQWKSGPKHPISKYLNTVVDVGEEAIPPSTPSGGKNKRWINWLVHILRKEKRLCIRSQRATADQQFSWLNWISTWNESEGLPQWIQVVPAKPVIEGVETNNMEGRSSDIPSKHGKEREKRKESNTECENKQTMEDVVAGTQSEASQ